MAASYYQRSGSLQARRRSGAVALSIVFTLVAGCFAPNSRRKPQDLGGEHVSFTTSDGVLLRGHLYGTGSTGVILAHMYPADQSDWTDFAQVLAAHGYQALTFDFRGFTESEGTSGTEFAGTDLLAAYQFMRPRVSQIFIAGASLGARGRNPGRRARGRGGNHLHLGADQLWRTRGYRFNPPRSRADTVCYVGRRSIGRRAAGNPVSIGGGAEIDRGLPGPRARHRDSVRTTWRGAAGADASVHRRQPEESERYRLRALARIPRRCSAYRRTPCHSRSSASRTCCP